MNEDQNQTGAEPQEPVPSAPPGQAAEPAQPAPSAEQPDATSTAPPPPYVPSPLPPAPRLVRRTDDKVIAGVCSGLAAYTGTDPVLWRVGAVLLALFSGGLAVIAYIVAWVVMPEASPFEQVPLREREPRDHAQTSRWIAMGAIVVGVLLLFRNVFEFRGGIFWGLVLIGLGIAFWGREFVGGSSRPSPPPPGPPPTPPPPTTTQFAAPQPSATAPTTPVWPGHTPPVPPVYGPPGPPTVPVPPRPRGRREPSILGRLVVGAAAVTVGIAVLLDNLDIVDVTAKAIFAVLLAIVGLGLLVGTWWGRARWLIFPGLAIALVLATVSYVPRGGTGQIEWSPTSLRLVESEYRHTAGEALLDLSAVSFGKRSRSIDVDLGFGELLVILPEDVNVVVDAHVQGGEMNLFGETTSGWDNERTTESKGEKNIGPVELDVEVTFGELVVRRIGQDVGAGRRDPVGGSRFRFNFRND